MVVNAPTSNIVSAAEHAIALVLAAARRVPQAHASLKAGVEAVGVHRRRALREDRSASSGSGGSASSSRSGSPRSG
jgi:phosphoglycerate dehydrogenase-like enzyme